MDLTFGSTGLEDISGIIGNVDDLVGTSLGSLQDLTGLLGVLGDLAGGLLG